MYLTRMTLNVQSRAVRRDLTDCHQLHRTMMSAGRTARADSGILYRVESDVRTGRVMLYVQSRVQPDWSRLPRDYLIAARPDPEVKYIAESYEAIRDGMLLAFRLRANPTRKVDTKSGPDGRRRNGRRVPLRTKQEHVQWLIRKGMTGGFAVLDVHCVFEPTELGKKIHASEDKGVGSTVYRLVLGSALFDGHLSVTDATTFRTTLEAGIGSGKAYGFGWLSVAPLPHR